jgi:auxin influx carrier (AUX1 LAX family)
MESSINGTDDKVVETVVVGRYMEMEQEGKTKAAIKSHISSLLWHGGSAYDAWFSCASNQVQHSMQYFLLSTSLFTSPTRVD